MSNYIKMAFLPFIFSTSFICKMGEDPEYCKSNFFCQHFAYGDSFEDYCYSDQKWSNTNYGCWCRSRLEYKSTVSRGIPVDQIDKTCKQYINALSCIEKDFPDQSLHKNIIFFIFTI